MNFVGTFTHNSCNGARSLELNGARLLELNGARLLELNDARWRVLKAESLHRLKAG